MDRIKAFIFDLDGVVVDTAKYHYLAWQRLAKSLGFEISPKDNERLKGVSRMASLEIVLSVGGIRATETEKEAYAERKNAWYREYLSTMDASEVLPGARLFIEGSRRLGLGTAIASASKNAGTIVEATGIAALFDAIADGYQAARAKPAPDIFLRAAEMLGARPSACVVFEDAAAGVEGAIAAGMTAVGIGDPAVLGAAALVLPGFSGLDVAAFFAKLGATAH
jgi:beta-phosphoglucomutase